MPASEFLLQFLLHNYSQYLGIVELKRKKDKLIIYNTTR